jgi:hypothetical protein
LCGERGGKKERGRQEREGRGYLMMRRVKLHGGTL